MKISFIDSGRTARCAPNPDYLDGIDVDISGGDEVCCLVELPYPAPRCGQWVVGCEDCQQVNIVTAAGRADDPRTLKIACKKIPKDRLQE